jgi:hypothetical protein
MRAAHFNPTMPRKPAVPAIPDKPTGQSKSERSQARPEPRPTEQFDFWDAFARSWEHDEVVEVAPPRPARTVRRRGSRKGAPSEPPSS